MSTITLPDGLALSRILAVPAIMWLIVGPAQAPDAWGARILAAALAGLAALTDLIDGYLARRWGMTTLLGAFLDTTADKLLVSGLLMALVARDGKVWLWPAIIIDRPRDPDHEPARAGGHRRHLHPPLAVGQVQGHHPVLRLAGGHPRLATGRSAAGHRVDVDRHGGHLAQRLGLPARYVADPHR
ncbi:MAG: CDP-alcohol phosphatidyltransferase family protein [Ardenticatenia bacterium]|nr:CDP-alcohol phosphatidyltransferase family protein [Ardenticatenia bacterium]